MEKITISTGHPDAGRVYAEAYEAALAREAVLREELGSSKQLANLWKEQERLRCVQLSAVGKDRDEIQQRLTVAEQRSAELESAAREMLRIAGIANQGSNAYNRAIINLNSALKPAAEVIINEGR